MYCTLIQKQRILTYISQGINELTDATRLHTRPGTISLTFSGDLVTFHKLRIGLHCMVRQALVCGLRADNCRMGMPHFAAGRSLEFAALHSCRRSAMLHSSWLRAY